jgi:hypothetical protein
MEAASQHQYTYNPMIPIYSGKLFSYFLCPIWTGVVDNNDLPIEVAVQKWME